MASFGTAIPYLAFSALAVALLWGSILAMRGRRWWATVVMTVGSGMQVLGALLTAGGSAWMMMSVMGAMGSAPSSASSASAMASTMSSGLFVIVGGLLVLGLGFVMFSAGFVGFCARYGAAERRAADLEGLVGELQQRIER